MEMNRFHKEFCKIVFSTNSFAFTVDNVKDLSFV